MSRARTKALGGRDACWRLCVISCALALGACSAISDFDYSFSDEHDAGRQGDGGSAGSGGGSGGDGGDAGGAGSGASGSGATLDQPQSTAQVGGGGTVTSSRYKLRVTLGAPQPLGLTESNGYRVRLGPRAGRQ